MNNYAYRELGTALFCIILVLATVFYLFKLRKVSLLFFFGAVVIGIRIAVSPFIYRKDVRRHNKEIAGIYHLKYVDSTFWNQTELLRLNSSKMILLSDGVFRIQNYPKDSADSFGLWTWCSDGNYFGVCFSNMDKSPFVNFNFRSDVPYKEIEISKWDDHTEKIVLKFSKTE